MSRSTMSGPLNSEAGFEVNEVTVIDENGGVLTPQDSYTADGAIALTTKVAKLNGASATVAATLADGTEGQEMVIYASDVTNAVTLTPDNLTDGTTITFDTANDAVTLKFLGASWKIISNYGTVVS